MKKRETLLPILFSIGVVLSLIVPAAAGASITMPRADERSIGSLAADSSDAALAMVLNTPQGNVTPMVAAGYSHTLGLKSDGTVVAVGRNNYRELNVGDWTDIIQVAARGHYTVALKSDGTVVAVGDNDYGQLNVGDWTGIIQVAAGSAHTVGLKSDGTVAAVGWNIGGQCEVSSWTGVTHVAAFDSHTVGVRADGTVVAVGNNGNGQCDVGKWTDITRTAAGAVHTAGLKSDGSVVAVGWNGDGECEVGGWADIVQVSAGFEHTVGLKSDGTVVAVGDNEYGQCDVDNWTDIIQVSAGYGYTVGLKSDGTVVEVGRNWDGQCDVSDWNLVLAVPKSQRVLTISSTAGGSVTMPGEGTFAYDTGTAVTLAADPDRNYDFVQWTGDTKAVANVNADRTTITVDNYYAITANFALEEGLCRLTTSSSAGGSVAAPGEGTYIYNEGTVVELVAEPEEGYHFVNWAGDVDTITDVTAAATNLTLGGDYSITANFVSTRAGNVGVEAGEWIKLDYEITGWPAGEPYPEWLKMEFLSIAGTSATTKVTLHMSDGTEQSDTVPVDILAGGETFGLAGGVIAANLTTGDSVYMTGYGDVPIEGEATRTYAGARRTVVYASISQSVPVQGEVRLTYYWDKQTGVLVESSTTSAGVTGTAKATETNMWKATTSSTPWWPWIIVAVAAGLATFFVRRKRSTRVKKALN